MAQLYTSQQLSGTSLPELTFSLPGNAGGFLLTNNSVWTLQVNSSIWSVPLPPYSVLTAPAVPGLSVTVKGVSSNPSLLTLPNPAVTWGTSTISSPLNIQPITATNSSGLLPTGTGNVVTANIKVTASGGSSSGSAAISLAPSGQVRIIGLLNWLIKSPNGIIYTVTLSGSLNGYDSLQYTSAEAVNGSLALTPVKGGPDLIDTLNVSLVWYNGSGNPPAENETVAFTAALDGNAVPNVSDGTSPVVSSILITGPSGLESPGALDPTSQIAVTMPVGGGTQGQPVPVQRRYVTASLPSSMPVGSSTIVSSTTVFTAGNIFLALKNTGSADATIQITDGNDVPLNTLTTTLAAGSTGYYLCVVSNVAINPTTLFNVAQSPSYKLYTSETLSVVLGEYYLLEG